MKADRLGWCVMALVMAVGGAARAAGNDGNPKNGLSSGVFLRNPLTTNPASLDILRTRSLPAALADPYIQLQLHHASARAMMEEIVECALDASVTVGFTDTRTSPSRLYQWRGDLGVCTSWATGAPSTACQQLVTACVTARVNALGKAIPLSLRGDPPATFPLAARVPQETRFREGAPGEDPVEGLPIGSFGQVCPIGAECGWSAGHVGRCTPGAPVRLVVQELNRCAATTLRVCRGLHGCLTAASGYPLPDDFPAPSSAYSWLKKEQLGVCPSQPLVFTCPEADAARGTYSVMIHAPPSGGVFSAPPVVSKLSGSGTYPASEPEVFGYREGAFYGNLFEAGGLTRSCELIGSDFALRCRPLDGTPLPEGCAAFETKPGGPCAEILRVPYKHVYACYSLTAQEEAADDVAGAAELNSRICNLPNGAHCFPTPPRRCRYVDPVKNAQLGAHCAWDPAAGIYPACEGATANEGTYRPITTYLNQPCDLATNDVCGKIRAD